MGDLPRSASPSGFTISGSSKGSRAFELLLREANNIFRQDEVRKPLSPRCRPHKVRKGPAQPHRHKRLATAVPGLTNLAPAPPSSPGPFNSPGAIVYPAEEAIAAILARPLSQYGHLTTEANTTEQAFRENEGSAHTRILQKNKVRQFTLPNGNPPSTIEVGCEESSKQPDFLAHVHSKFQHDQSGGPRLP
ncbi:hypothetical protein MRX96_021544 [Rhipicephalus microplus]